MKIDNRPVVKIFTDGSYRAKNNIGGWAAIMESGPHKQAIFGNEKLTTINRMEVGAIINALEQLTVPCKVEIISDSMVAIHGTNKLNGKANLDQWSQIAKLKQIHDITMVKVKAHTKSKHPTEHERGNAIVDCLAQFASSQRI